LPDAAADVEDLHDEEVKVEDVVEEGIVMGTADIIMQVWMQSPSKAVCFDPGNGEFLVPTLWGFTYTDV
jgi:hypothetical protein